MCKWHKPFAGSYCCIWLVKLYNFRSVCFASVCLHIHIVLSNGVTYKAGNIAQLNKAGSGRLGCVGFRQLKNWWNTALIPSDLIYIGEARRCMRTGLAEHKATVHRGDEWNSIAVHVHQPKHRIDWELARVRITARSHWNRSYPDLK